LYVREFTHCEDKLDLGRMDSEERHLEHPKQKEGQEISGGYSSTLRKVVSHMPP
jgi:hypothetical protein